jgi:predicted GNAT family acetyltransferase
MNNVELKLDANNRGAFVVEENNQRLAEMAIGISGSNLTVYHTEVSDKLRGTGVSGKLLDSMTTYARTHQLKVIPLCSFVNAQFRRHPERYDDIWNKDWHHS